MRIEFEVHGEKQVSRELLRLGDRGGDAKPALARLAERLVQFEQRQFDTQGASGSAGWAPLAASTIRAKASKGHDPRILRATERLRRSLVSLGGPEQILQVTDSFLRFGTSVPYAGYHQSGTGRMPRRRVVELSETQRRLMVRDLQRWVVTGELL